MVDFEFVINDVINHYYYHYYYD